MRETKRINVFIVGTVSMTGFIYHYFVKGKETILTKGPYQYKNIFSSATGNKQSLIIQKF